MQKRTIMDILALSNISSFVYFYEDRVSLAIAFNISDVSERATLGLLEKGMVHRDMKTAVNVDEILVLRYLCFSRGRSVIDVLPGQRVVSLSRWDTIHPTIAALTSMYRNRRDKDNEVSKKDEMIILTAYDRYSGNHVVWEMLPFCLYYVSNQITWYYHDHSYKYDAAYRDILGDIGIPLKHLPASSAIEYIEDCMAKGRAPMIVKKSIAYNLVSKWPTTYLIDELYKLQRIDILTAFFARWPEKKKNVFWQTEKDMNRNYPKLLK